MRNLVGHIILFTFLSNKIASDFGGIIEIAYIFDLSKFGGKFKFPTFIEKFFNVF